MGLPQSDMVYLNDRGVVHHIASESNMTCVVMPRVAAPERIRSGRIGPVDSP